MTDDVVLLSKFFEKELEKILDNDARDEARSAWINALQKLNNIKIEQLKAFNSSVKKNFGE